RYSLAFPLAEDGHEVRASDLLAVADRVQHGAGGGSDGLVLAGAPAGGNHHAARGRLPAAGQPPAPRRPDPRGATRGTAAGPARRHRPGGLAAAGPDRSRATRPAASAAVATVTGRQGWWLNPVFEQRLQNGAPARHGVGAVGPDARQRPHAQRGTRAVELKPA